MSSTFLTTRSPLGPLTLVRSEQGLSGIYFENQRHWPKESDSWTLEQDPSRFAEAQDFLDAYFSSQPRAFSFPVDLSAGTAFQRSVWSALRKIPYGKTCSYSQLAEKIGAPTAVRAVAAAVARNPLSILIPCHRVIGRNGSLTGYAGGLDRKRWLLAHEGVKNIEHSTPHMQFSVRCWMFDVRPDRAISDRCNRSMGIPAHVSLDFFSHGQDAHATAQGEHVCRFAGNGDAPALISDAPAALRFAPGSDTKEGYGRNHCQHQPKPQPLGIRRSFGGGDHFKFS